MSEKESRLHQFLKQCGQGVIEVEHSVLGAVKRVPHLKHDHTPVRNVNEQVKESFTLMERVALFITQRVGSFGFFDTWLFPVLSRAPERARSEPGRRERRELAVAGPRGDDRARHRP